MKRFLTILLGLLSACMASAQIVNGPGGGGGSGCSGAGTVGYVATATSNGTPPTCDWETIGGASVSADTIKNAWYISDGGAANAITGTTSTAFPGAYATGQAIIVKMAATNTAATTINVNSLGTKAVTKSGTTALAAGNLVTGRVYLMVYDGTEFQVLAFTILAADVPTLNQSTTANAGTATALAANPSNCSAGSIPRGIDASGTAEGCAAISLTADVSGLLPAANLVNAGVHTGDAVGTFPAVTLNTVNSNVGTFGDSTHIAQVIVNAKGLVTAVSNVAVSGGGGTGCIPSGTINQILVDSGSGACTSSGVTIDPTAGVAGGIAMPQGTPATAPTSSVGFQAPASVTTKFMMNLPAAPVTGFVYNTGTTDPSVISFQSNTAATALLNDCSGLAKGLVPTPPNNTTTFLRGDCTFATPADGGTVTSSGSPAIHQVPVFTTGTDIKGIAVGATDKPLVGVSSNDPVFSKLTLTNPATAATLTIADGKTLISSNTLTLTATDGSTLAIGGGGTLGSNAYTSTAYAPLASPTFTGTPAAPTPAATDNSTTIPTTAYVTTAITNAVNAAAGRDLVQAATAAVLPNTPSFTHVDSGIGSFLTSSTNSVLVVDGYTPILNDRILVKNQATAANNGIYKVTQLGIAAVTPWIMLRALDYDQASDMNNTIVPVANNGTANPLTSWIMTATVATVDTDAVNFVAFTPNGANLVTAVSPGAGLCHFAGSTQTCTSSAVVEADITLANNTTNNVSTSKHGFAPILPNDATKYLDGTGAYSVPSGGGGGGDTCLANATSPGLPVGALPTIEGYPGGASVNQFGPGNVGANIAISVRVHIPCTFTPSKISFALVTATATANVHLSANLYSTTGTLLISSGVLSGNGGTTVRSDTTGVKTLTASTSPAATGLGSSIAAGDYIVVVTSDEATSKFAAAIQETYMTDLISASVASSGLATATSGGAPNSTLGTITYGQEYLPLITFDK